MLQSQLSTGPVARVSSTHFCSTLQETQIEEKLIDILNSYLRQKSTILEKPVKVTFSQTQLRGWNSKKKKKKIKLKS